MSFPGTHTPKKGESRKKQKYEVPMRQGKHGVMEYYFTPDLEAAFIRLYPITMNPDLMGLFGMGFSTLQRFKRELGLKKNMKVIKHKQAMMIKRKCEKNGYYDSLRGKQPSPQCIEASKEWWADGNHPLKNMSKRKYNAFRKKMKEYRLKQMMSEKRRVEIGLPQKTKLHLPQFKYKTSQVSHRMNAVKRGYILGDIREKWGERYTIYYNDDTERSALFERNLIKDGFTLKELPKPKKVRPSRMTESEYIYC